MNCLADFLSHVRDKEKFTDLGHYMDFGYNALKYIEDSSPRVIQACNRENYSFFQLGQEAHNQLTRPFNSNLLYNSEEFLSHYKEFLGLLKIIEGEKRNSYRVNRAGRELILRTIYTVQQAIGFILDGLTEKNASKKLNGDHFERLMLCLFNYINIPVRNGVVKVPVVVEGETSFHVNYQHDFINEDINQSVNLIGSVKTTSKDRVDKIFMDKFLYSRLTNTRTPHIGIFLHDVQRKSYKTDPNKFGISSTFLTGKFKGYTLKLNPLDGVYYFDLNPNMISDPILASQIKTFDKLICEDIWQYT
ncbi:hypothetical protein ABEP42_26565 [Priestia megaterium]